MWQLIQDNFISNYHEYLGDLHHMLVALSKIQTFVFSWTPLVYIDRAFFDERIQNDVGCCNSMPLVCKVTKSDAMIN